MACIDRNEVSRLLFGDLDHRATLRVMDHVRHCAECKAFLTENSRYTSGRSADEADEPVAAKAARERAIVVDDDGDARPWVPRAPTPPAARRFKLRWFVPLIGLVIAGMYPGIWRRQGAVPARLDSASLMVADAVAEGLPHVASPRGRVDARPKVFSLILPPGENAVTVSVFRDRQEVWKHTYRRDDAGCQFDRLEITSSDGGKRPATEAMMPFPTVEELELPAGASHVVWLALPNANESLPVRLELTR